jgi:uncharacterized protein (DUF3084 family)
MNLREKVINAFAATYIENEKVIVRNLLQTGRIDEEEWEKIAQQLNQLAEEYNTGDKEPEEFLAERKEVRKNFNRSREEKKAGLTREESEGLYQEIEEEQRETLEKAFTECGYSTIRMSMKILISRLKFIAARLKNI